MMFFKNTASISETPLLDNLIVLYDFSPVYFT